MTESAPTVPLYQWQTVSKVNGQYPVHDPDQVHPVQRLNGQIYNGQRLTDQPVGTLDVLKDARPKDLDIGRTAWRLRRVGNGTHWLNATEAWAKQVGQVMPKEMP